MHGAIGVQWSREAGNPSSDDGITNTHTPAEDRQDRTRTNDREQATSNGRASNEREDDDPQHAAGALPLARAGESLERIGRHGGLGWGVGEGLWCCLSPSFSSWSFGSPGTGAVQQQQLASAPGEDSLELPRCPAGVWLGVLGLIGVALARNGQPCRGCFTARQNSK
jgi:hypothetical protein